MKSSATADGSIRDSIPVIRDFPPASELGEDSGSPQMKRRKTSRGIAALDVDYANHKSHVEKAREVMQFEREGRCAVCRNELEHDAGIYTVCPNAGCESVSHLTCLSRHFLESDESASLIPIAGKCPGCHAELRWVDVVKELTLRMRGQKEVEKLLKGKRVRKANAESSSQAMLETSDSNEFSDDEIESDIMEELKMLQKFNPTGSKMDMGDSWHVIDASDDSDTQSIASIASRTKKDTSYKTNPGGLVTVVEDSDWDDAEILD
jgi:structure-specific endonuclease subunit SLX1